MWEPFICCCFFFVHYLDVCVQKKLTHSFFLFTSLYKYKVTGMSESTQQINNKNRKPSFKPNFGGGGYGGGGDDSSVMTGISAAT